MLTVAGVSEHPTEHAMLRSKKIAQILVFQATKWAEMLPLPSLILI